ncbi:hypothetical protein [Flagellimonas allohymeniacidonis]|uniref:Uncharacterized protein n=1 Tax=Flagellimonas allohymeniacidonis TaxID=2517819 RepID=A0A4Q8QH66_9FLAO|nr:hypothetical protein [Allomuricauda hymeniacidonis]TAI49097.1 hypothetical protein EW142_04695 [Allomuricauda hymeniacidonis]
MENLEAFYILGGAINGIFKLIIAAACVILLIRERNLATIFMCIGSILTIFFSLGSVLWTTLAASRSSEALIRSNAIMNLAAQIPVILFAIGILLFALQYGKKIALLKKLTE